MNPAAGAPLAVMSAGDDLLERTSELATLRELTDRVRNGAGAVALIEGPAGMDLTGWTIVLYDGTNTTAYSTTALSGTIPAARRQALPGVTTCVQCQERGESLRARPEPVESISRRPRSRYKNLRRDEAKT